MTFSQVGIWKCFWQDRALCRRPLLGQASPGSTHLWPQSQTWGGVGVRVGGDKTAHSRRRTLILYLKINWDYFLFPLKTSMAKQNPGRWFLEGLCAYHICIFPALWLVVIFLSTNICLSLKYWFLSSQQPALTWKQDLKKSSVPDLGCKLKKHKENLTELKNRKHRSPNKHDKRIWSYWAWKKEGR